MVNPRQLDKELEEGCLKVLAVLQERLNETMAEIDFMISKKQTIERKIQFIKKNILE